jgi:hypothetical protein
MTFSCKPELSNFFIKYLKVWFLFNTAYFELNHENPSWHFFFLCTLGWLWWPNDLWSWQEALRSCLLGLRLCPGWIPRCLQQDHNIRRLDQHPRLKHRQQRLKRLKHRRLNTNGIINFLPLNFDWKNWNLLSKIK